MKHHSDRRRFLACAAAALPLVAAPGLVLGAQSDARRLRFLHAHTGEKLEVVYHESGAYVPDALDALNHIMRDFRSDEVTSMDPALLDFLHTTQQQLGSRGTFEIISAYRSPVTNEMLRRRGGGVAKRSMHLRGRAIDVRLTDADTRDLRRAARELARGGVGYYSRSNFVHLDTGRVRWW
jgi:uncharacterized protein YcbK (DUF882 family)